MRNCSDSDSRFRLYEIDFPRRLADREHLGIEVLANLRAEGPADERSTSIVVYL
jgi:hypothetical protein